MNLEMASAFSKDDMAKILKQAGLEGERIWDTKVVVVRNKGSGKTSFILSFVTDTCTKYLQTCTKDSPVLDEPAGLKAIGPQWPINIVMRELPAYDHLAHVRAQAYFNAQAIVIRYSVADRASWLAIPKWFSEASSHLPDAKVFAVGNMLERRVNDLPVSLIEGKGMAQAIGADKYYEISTYSGQFVHEMARSIVKRLMC